MESGCKESLFVRKADFTSIIKFYIQKIESQRYKRNCNNKTDKGQQCKSNDDKSNGTNQENGSQHKFETSLWETFNWFHDVLLLPFNMLLELFNGILHLTAAEFLGAGQAVLITE